MPIPTLQTPVTLVPQPGTAEALELGCSCQLIVHESATDEKEPAGMMLDPDPNCPLHGSNREGSSAIFI